jgi:hypothetical protein
MIDIYKKKSKGIIAHFHTARLVVPIGEHRLKIGSELFSARAFRIFTMKLSIIFNVPPISFPGAVT